ncbi:MAG: transporter substrate-binding domain-containing protein, partial [Prevotella sp.]|nr:transporter substrate-binding domain-containing protein [Prevotella sp.]
MLLFILCGVMSASAAHYESGKGGSSDGFFSRVLSGSFLNALTNTDDDEMEEARQTAPPLGIRYTKKHPLIIVGDWAFRPYAFINDHGEPDGFQIELLKEIFNRMHVPYEIHLMDWHQAKTEVQAGRAQVMIDIEKNDVMPGVVYGKEVLAEYKIGVMRRKETLQLRSIQFLSASDTVYCYENDYAERWLSTHLSEMHRNGGSCVIETINPYLTFGDITSGKIKYYIWGKYALRNLERLYDTENDLEIDDIDVPAGKFRFYASDTLLASELDAQFRRLVESGFYDSIHDRWLSDTENVSPGYTAIDIALIIFLLTLTVIFIFVAVVTQRNISVSTLKHEFSAIIDNSEDISSCQIWVINVATQWVSNLAGNFLPPKGLSFPDYEKLIHPDDLHFAVSARHEVDEGCT